MAARSATLSKRENKIGVSRMSSVLGGSRTRLVLGGSVLGGDDLDGGADELLTATMDVILLILGCDLANAGMRSRWCYRRRDLAGAGVQRDRCDLGLGSVLGCNETNAWCDLFLLFLSLSLSSIFLGWISFEGKIKLEMVLRVRQGILRSTQKMNSV